MDIYAQAVGQVLDIIMGGLVSRTQSYFLLSYNSTGSYLPAKSCPRLGGERMVRFSWFLDLSFLGFFLPFSDLFVFLAYSILPLLGVSPLVSGMRGKNSTFED